VSTKRLVSVEILATDGELRPRGSVIVCLTDIAAVGRVPERDTQFIIRMDGNWHKIETGNSVFLNEWEEARTFLG
jgi:hypothetical protein